MDLWTFNLRHLAALAATVRLGSLSAAAQSVSLTQPALTQGIAKLEGQFGQPLFDRRPGGMVATDAGRLIAARIETALAHIASPKVTMAQVRALIALADAGSFAAASAATGLSQPTLHRAVGDLSIVTRRAMTERRGKGIALTEAGRRRVRAFRLARAELVAGLSEVAALNGLETGRISVGAMPLARARLLPAAVAAFHRLHPEISIRVVEGSHAELIEPLRDGEVDILIGALRRPSPGDDVIQSPLFRDRPIVIGRAGHPLAHKQEVSTAELAAYPWTISAPDTPLRLLWETMFSDAGVTPPSVPVECGSVITIRQLLLDSDFLTLLSPDQVAVELEAGWLARVVPLPLRLSRTIGTTVRAGWRPTPAQRQFLGLITAIAEPSIS